MKKQDAKISRPEDEVEISDWLAAALHLAGDAAAFESADSSAANLSAGFHRRCRQAAGQALAILKMRQERQRIGFLAVPLADYLQGLMKVAGVSLSQVLAATGITDLALQTPGPLTAVGGLAQAIGMSLREVLVHLRIGIAAQSQPVPMTLLVAHRHAGDPRRSPLEICEAVLLQIESTYDAGGLNHLRAAEQAIRRAYREGGHDPT